MAEQPGRQKVGPLHDQARRRTRPPPFGMPGLQGMDQVTEPETRAFSDLPYDKQHDLTVLADLYQRLTTAMVEGGTPAGPTQQLLLQLLAAHKRISCLLADVDELGERLVKVEDQLMKLKEKDKKSKDKKKDKKSKGG